MTTLLLTKRIGKIAVFVAILFLFSCADQGCIEADDFGEYETETLEIPANPSEDACKYDVTAPLDDASAQGSEVRACFTTGSHTITLDDGSNQTSNPGCNHFGVASYQSICVTECVNKCLSKQTLSTNGSLPTWISTSKKDTSLNAGITIRPGSQIMVRATGLVTLGDRANYPNAYVAANNALLSYSDKTNWTPIVFDAKSGQTVNVAFSGKATINDSPVEVLGDGPDSASSTYDYVNTYNAARRIVAYTISHPNGYYYDSTKIGKERYPFVNLVPDADAWRCVYAVGGSKTEASCNSLAYKDIGYPDSNSSSDVFPIDSTNRSQGLGSYGGMIRWSTDGLAPERDADNPFITNSVKCNINTGICSNIDTISPQVGLILGDPGDGNDIIINNPYTNDAVQVSFASLAADDGGSWSNSCNIDNLVVYILNADSTMTTMQKSIKVSVGTFVTRSTSDNSIVEIPLEPGQKVKIQRINTVSGGTNCGRLIAARFNKYQDIKMNKSGFVKFTMLNAASGSPSCSLIGRIINPSNIYPFSDDFYEYDNFLTPAGNASSTDPLGKINAYVVPPSPSSASGKVWSDGGAFGNDALFVRKGQVIRLSPRSWNGSWTSSAGERQCGIGMAMYIDERPAILCKNKVLDRVASTTCLPDIDHNTGNLLGCQELELSCSDNSTTSYCPTACQGVITCTALGNSSNFYTKTGCSISSGLKKDPANCQANVFTATVQSNCARCNNKMLDNVTQPALVEKDLYQCYDLENYTGRVSNIPYNSLATSYSSKGAAPLGQFNGVYGNFESFSKTTETDSEFNGNIIYKLKNPFTFSRASRLSFFIVDGSDFKTIKSAYTNNSSGASYDGSNGFRINLSGTLQFSNGQWLEAVLCKESDVDGTACRSSSISLPSTLRPSGQPSLVEIKDPDARGGLSDPVITTEYYFDDVGNLIRKTPMTEQGGDCLSSAGTPVVTVAGSNFYCHTYQYFSPSQMQSKTQADQSAINTDISKLRLTFRIKDPENPAGITGTGVGAGCHIPRPKNCNLPGTHPAAYNGYSSDAGCVATDPTADVIDGIRQSNPGYRNECKTSGSTVNNGYYSGDGSGTCLSNANNTGQTCDFIGSGDDVGTCAKEFYCASTYGNNSGKYTVNIKVKNPVGNGVSNIIEGVIKPIIEVMDGPPVNCSKSDPSSTIAITFDGTKKDNPNFNKSDILNRGAICSSADDATCQKQYICADRVPGQAEKMYIQIINDSIYQTLLSMFLGVMVTFYGFGYLMGVSNLSQQEVLGRVIKIGLIYLFVGDAGWDWFNKIVVHFFKDGTDYLAFMMASSFDNSPDILNSIQKGDYYDKSILFSSVDKVFGIFFSQAIQKKISALLFASIFGWIYLIIIYFSFLLYIYAVANAVLLYLTAQVFISILFILGPIFFIFTLFSQTKDMFENWLKQLIGFSLQQIFLLTTLAFFNMLMYEVIKMAFGFKICWDDVWTIHLFGAVRITLLSFWTVASLPPRTNVNSDVGNIGNPDGIPSLFSILFIWVVASLMNKFIAFMTDLGASLGGGISLSSLSSGVKAFAEAVKKGAMKTGQEYWSKTGGAAIREIDDALFDSGENADKRRKQKKQKANEDKNNRASMSRAADDAVKRYKKENMAEFSGKSREEQRKIVEGIRDKAMNKRGEELGLDKRQIENLKNSKGLDYFGSNAFGLAAAVGKQAFSKGGNLVNSLNEQNASSDNSKVSKKDLSKSMDKMTEEQRNKVQERVNSGQLEVEKTTSEKALSGTKAVLGGIAKVVGSPIKTAKAIGRSVARRSSYNKARDALIRSGDLPETAGPSFLNKFVDSDATKKKVRQKEREMLAQSRVEKKSNTASTRAEVERKNKLRTALERPEALNDEKNTGVRVRKEGTLASKIFGREKKVTAAKIGKALAAPFKALINPQETVRNNNSSQKAQLKLDRMNNTNEQYTSALRERDSLREMQGKITGDMNAVNNMPVPISSSVQNFAQAQNRLGQITKRLSERGVKANEKAELKKEQKQITGNKEYQAGLSKMSTYKTAHAQNATKIMIANQKVDRLRLKQLKQKQDQFFDSRKLNDAQKYLARKEITSKRFESGKALTAWKEENKGDASEMIELRKKLGKLKPDEEDFK